MKFKFFFKWLTICLLTAFSGGIIGALFSHSVSFVTDFREKNDWILFLLPLGGILTVFIYKKLGTTHLGSHTVLGYLKGDKSVSPKLLPAVFTASVLTHLFGGSAGREGAALQMGGGAATLISKIFKLSKEESQIATICGMSAFFSALFGTPLGAGIFAVEVMFDKKLSLKAFLPSITSSFFAFTLAKGLLVHPERFSLALPSISLAILWKTATIILLSCAVCVLFIFSLHFTDKLGKKYLKNHYIKILVGSVLIIALTLLVGCRDYNGGGLQIVEKVFSESQVKNEAFILKILFTAITIAAGFKGGEIVPTLFIGATFGGGAALLLGSSIPLGGAIGMAVLFSGATNCPLATIFLCCEIFGIKGILYFAAASITSFLLTGKKRLYEV